MLSNGHRRCLAAYLSSFGRLIVSCSGNASSRSQEQQRAPAVCVDLGALTRQGGLTEVLDRFDYEEDLGVDSSTFARLLLACGKTKALIEGKRVHRHLIRRGFGQDTFLGSHLVHMYLKCGSLVDAEELFRRMPVESVDIATWSALIAARAELGQWKHVFDLLEELEGNGLKPDRITFITLLKLCSRLGALAEGKLIHARLAGSMLEFDVTVGNAIVNMYDKCGCLDEAAQHFHRMPTWDVVSWTAMIGAYAQHGHCRDSLEMFQQMQLYGFVPNKVTFINVLSACESSSDLREGKTIHGLIVESGYDSDVTTGNCLVSMYSKCDSLEDARTTFDRMRGRDVISWTSIIAAHSRKSRGCKEALQLYSQMLLDGLMPNKLTFSMVLNACGTLAASKAGKLVHSHIVESGIEWDAVGISLVNMYGKCLSLEDARRVFDSIHNRNLVMWNSMITAYQDENPREALQLFRRMQPEGVTPDRITFITVLNACTNLMDLEEGKTTHSRIVGSGFAMDVLVATALFNMYGKCGSMEDARHVFDNMTSRDVVSWNAIITAYVQHQYGRAAIRLFQQMQLEGMPPNKSTFASLLNACIEPEFLADGKRIHFWITESRLESNVVLGTGLLNMYANCGSLDNARGMFDKIFMDSQHHKDVVLWTSMITAYEQHGKFREALELYEQMHARAVMPDKVTLVAVFNTCANLVALPEGKRIHARVIESGLDSDISVTNAILNMYGKCGSFDNANMVFEKMQHKDVTSWSAMIASYAQHGHSYKALQVFRKMRQEGSKMNDVTFVAVLSACSHVGLVEEGCEYFVSMPEHGFSPTPEHYGCVVDLLARAGHLGKTEEFIQKMPFPPNVVMWTTFLAACRTHGDVLRGRCAAQKLQALDPQNDVPYVMLSGIYSSSAGSDYSITPH